MAMYLRYCLNKSSPIQISPSLKGSAGFDFSSVPNIPGTEIGEMESTLKVLAVHKLVLPSLSIFSLYLARVSEGVRPGERYIMVPKASSHLP